MRVVPLNEVKNRLSVYLKLCMREDIVVTKNGRAAAILHGVTDEDLEDYLFESDPKFIARIESLRREYQREGGTGLAEVAKSLGLSSRRRRKISANKSIAARG
jgi:prevent-host-death family protein